jgi:hypothetical protein
MAAYIQSRQVANIIIQLAGFPCSAGENSCNSCDAGAGAGARIAKKARDSQKDSQRIRHSSAVIPAHSGACTQSPAARYARAFMQQQVYDTY